MPLNRSKIDPLLLFLLTLGTLTVSLLPALHAAAWPVERRWSPAEEHAFSTWVSEVGSRQWRNINHLVRDQRHNRLYDPSDQSLLLHADCADLPVMLRAYYAYKRKLPFVITAVDGGRYSRNGNNTSAVYDNLSHRGDAQSFLRFIPNILHTGTFRTRPSARDSLTYPVAVLPRSIRPGTVFYSPEGHAGIVTEVTPNGAVYLLDGHPDQTVTRTLFSPKLVWQSTAHVGGFKAFRPVDFQDGRVSLDTDNRRLPYHSSEQYTLTDYYGEVRTRLSRRKVDPLADLEQTIRKDIYSEVLDRVQAVELGWAIGKKRNIPVPPNIYTAVGDWENVSTPSRDIRLRRAFLQIPDLVRTSLLLCQNNPDRLARGVTRNPKKLGRTMLARKEKLFRSLKFAYRNSVDQSVTLNLADLEKRLFLLSFDPNHTPELRWGATGPELTSAPASPHRFIASYPTQQPWRNRLQKKQGPMRPSDGDNPRNPPVHNLSAIIESVIRGESDGR